MNKKIGTIIKNTLSFIIFVALLCAAIYKCADILEYKEAREKYTSFFESETNFDVIYLGTSHVWNSVFPMEIWEETGISSFNWGYSNCTPAENYYLIQDILKYTSPKVVVMDAMGIAEYEEYGNGKYRDDRIEQQHVQFDSFPIWSVNKYNASKDVFDNYDDNEDFIWNFIMYHNRWSELGEEDFNYSLSTEKGATFLTGLGCNYYPPISEDEKTDIDTVCLPYFLNIIEYCNENNIQVLCVYLPFPADETQQRLANTVGDLVSVYPNCTYVNMLNKDILDFYTDICTDDMHLNYSGGRKVSLWLGDYLASNYSLTDYSESQSWINDYEQYYLYKKETLQSQDLFLNYLVQLSDDDFTAELEIYNYNIFTNGRLQMLYDNAGIVPVYIENPDTDKCAKMTISSTYNGEFVEEVYFQCNGDGSDIYGIIKATE